MSVTGELLSSLALRTLSAKQTQHIPSLAIFHLSLNLSFVSAAALLRDVVTMFRTQPLEFDYWVEPEMVSCALPHAFALDIISSHML